MANGPTKKLAVLIDADNASARIADGLFDEVARIGEATLRRIYGDFSRGAVQGWDKDTLARHAIQPQQQFAYTSGKNSSDITLVIDAMDLLHSGRFDGFCLVSSDSDFTRLAARLREQGVDVYGIGQQKTPESFRQACTRFIFTENFAGEQTSEAGVPSRQAEPKDALPLLEKAIGELEEDADGWFRLGTVGQRLNNLSPEFDSRSYGQPKLSDLVAATGRFEVDRKGPQGPRMRLARNRRGRPKGSAIG
jgi:hypothetical protein